MTERNLREEKMFKKTWLHKNQDEANYCNRDSNTLYFKRKPFGRRSGVLFKTKRVAILGKNGKKVKHKEK